MVRRVDWSIDSDADVPPSRQLVELVLDAILQGELEPGSQLPSVRALAAEALVNHNTVGRAYQELLRLGVSEAISGVGVFVTLKGPEVAATERRAATWLALQRALGAALRAGHGYEEIQRLLKELAWSRRSA